MQFTLTCFLGALAAFATASPVDHNLNEKNSLNAKCFSGCDLFQGIASLNQATWADNYVYGTRNFGSFQELIQGFRSFSIICSNTFSQWTSNHYQFEQISSQIHMMVIQFQVMVNQFSLAGGCHICDPSYDFQFRSVITPVFLEIQNMIKIIIRTYSIHILQFQPDFQILNSSLRVIAGLFLSLNINISNFFVNTGIDLNIFSSVGINLSILFSLDITTLFNSRALLTPVDNVSNGVGVGLL
ncbi:secreted protein [Melampsora americana]|nr:secreted protein [Melampsora americana]